MAIDLIQPLNPYNAFVNKDGILTRDSYNYLYNIFMRLGGSLSNLNAVTLQNQTWESPGTIGSITPNTGAFTTLTASGAVNLGTGGTGVVLQGTTAGGNAAAGKVGEYLTSTSTPSALVTNVDAIKGTLSLTAGDWDVSATVVYTGNPGVTTVTELVCGLSTAAVMPAATQVTALVLPVTTTTATPHSLTTPTTRFSLASAATINAIVRSVFAASTMNATVLIRARRVR